MAEGHSRSTMLLFVIIGIVLFIPHITRAEYISLPLVSGGFSWEASVDGENWLPAYPEYPNNVTTPYPETTDGVFMWYWDAEDGFPTGRNGENTVYFRSTFMISDLHGYDAGAWIAADDWMEMSVNGESVATYLLTDEWVDGQPVPSFVDFTSYLNTRYQGDLTGYNTITIQAHDGSLAAYNRGYEWVFFDAYNVNSVPVLDSPSGLNHPTAVPEPAVGGMLLGGMVGLCLTYDKKRLTPGHAG